MRSAVKLAAFLAASLAFDFMAMNVSEIAAHAATPKMPTFYASRDYPGWVCGPIVVADANGDGIPDVLVGGMGNIEALLGNGDVQKSAKRKG
jgi:hypothetical protein